MPKTAREIMTGGAECAQAGETVVDAARKMRDLGVGALPICGDDNRLKGMITDRDIAVKVIAEGQDPGSVKVIDLADQSEVVTIGADDSLDEALRTMSKNQVRRLPVIDGHDLVGMVSIADIAGNIEDGKAGDLIQAISSGPDNN
jgi:CBS domain-containing protein